MGAAGCIWGVLLGMAAQDSPAQICWRQALCCVLKSWLLAVRVRRWEEAELLTSSATGAQNLGILTELSAQHQLSLVMCMGEMAGSATGRALARSPTPAPAGSLFCPRPSRALVACQGKCLTATAQSNT